MLDQTSSSFLKGITTIAATYGHIGRTNNTRKTYKINLEQRSIYRATQLFKVHRAGDK